MIDPPRGWGEDELSHFFDIPRHNLFAVFANLPKEYADIRDIDRAFLNLLEGMVDPESVSAAPLAYRAHSAFRAACQLTLSGQLPEAYMVMRGCLEHALYANHIASHPDAWDIWRRRGETEESRKKCVAEFAGRKIFKSLSDRDQRLGDIAKMLYERSIDLGAHPNEMAVGGSVSITESTENTTFIFSYVAGDGISLRLAIKSLGQTGLIVIDTLCLIFTKRCAEQAILASLQDSKTRF